MLAVSGLTLLLVSAPTSLALFVNSPAWGALNTTVGGRLVQGIPFARSCFPLVSNDTGGNFDEQECDAVKSDYLDHFLLASKLGGYMNTQWQTCQRTGAECLLDSTNPANAEADSPPRVCSQGSIPEFGIHVASAKDVLAGVNFSKEHGIPLVIKNSGHDFKGRSSGPGTLALWMSNLNSIEQKPHFVPTGCSSRQAKNAVTVGAGVSFSDLVTFADEQNLTIPSGGDLTVGAAGGFVQGGGHSILSNVFGLAADRVLEFEVVTPRGDHLVANGCQNTDLFFALRGGGGGTFGIVMKMTTEVFPSMAINAVFASFDPTVGDNRLEFLRFVTDQSLEFAKQGWGTYIIPRIGILLANPTLSPTAANASVATLRTFMTTNLTGTFTMTVEPNYKTFFDKYIGALVHVPVGIPMTPSSRLVPVEYFETASKRAELVSTLATLFDSVESSIVFGTTPFLFGPEHDETSVSPAWRNSLWHVNVANAWNFNTTVAGVALKYSSLTSAVNPLRDLTRGSGAYQNEADVYEPNHEASFWGKHYPRLLAIKQKYDPEHILDCWQCVGWLGPSNSRYKCYI
ncbi:FAD-binding domain-containing protein [Mycena albidolilacea]|uniref:FAD-binding domain-containing protein n=1 Tax=Mycena albidolilacea TaxID=1033008 RepID=A0AAD7EAA8_9AGAR|nr:FAD-binding domain-containing protein [Mycena albidolilacea]